MSDPQPSPRRPFFATRWLPWTLFGISVLTGFLLLITTVAVAASKTIPVAGPRVTVAASPLPAVTVAARPLPAKTVTVAEDNSDEVNALKLQLAECNSAWQEIAQDESRALTLYNSATSSIIKAVQEGDAAGLEDATDNIKKSTSIVNQAKPKLFAANATCTAD